MDEYPTLIEFYWFALLSLPGIIWDSISFVKGLVAVIGAAALWFGLPKLGRSIVSLQFDRRWAVVPVAILVIYGVLDSIYNGHTDTLKIVSELESQVVGVSRRAEVAEERARVLERKMELAELELRPWLDISAAKTKDTGEYLRYVDEGTERRLFKFGFTLTNRGKSPAKSIKVNVPPPLFTYNGDPIEPKSVHVGEQVGITDLAPKDSSQVFQVTILFTGLDATSIEMESVDFNLVVEYEGYVEVGKKYRSQVKYNISKNSAKLLGSKLE